MGQNIPYCDEFHNKNTSNPETQIPIPAFISSKPPWKKCTLESPDQIELIQ